MCYTLRNECGHNTVYRLVCINDIRFSYRRTYRYKYIKSNVENILNSDFNTTDLNQK